MEPKIHGKPAEEKGAAKGHWDKNPPSTVVYYSYPLGKEWTMAKKGPKNEKSERESRLEQMFHRFPTNFDVDPKLFADTLSGVACAADNTFVRDSLQSQVVHHGEVILNKTLQTITYPAEHLKP
jgi:hypothetical protein